MAYDGDPDDWRPPRRDTCTTCNGTGMVPLLGFGCMPGHFTREDVRCYWCGGTGFDEDVDPWRN